MKRPSIMGIVNVTPDSFSGDGKLGEAAVAAADALAAAGADIVDLGAESTRPGGLALSAADEWVRLGPVLERLATRDWRAHVRLSVDTRHAETAARALALGVDMINDVGALADPDMAPALKNSGCDVVVMHALSVPVDPDRTLPADCDVVREVLHWKDTVVHRARVAGIAPKRLVYDPGIGFGKTAAQSLALMLAAATLVEGGGRWLFGHSRKSFLQLFTEAQAAQRDDLTLAFSAQLAGAGVQMLRVHAVARHVAMLRGCGCAA